jgi:hypothetical protein
MKEDAVQTNDGKNEDKKFGQRTQIFSGCLVLKEKQELGW